MKEKENGIAVLAAIAIICLLALCLLASCNTKKTITETLYMHDTLYSHSVDTIKEERVIHLTDTLRIENEKIITLIQREEGRVDTFRIETIRDTYKSSNVVDSLRELKSSMDSLLRAYTMNHNKEITKKSYPPWKWILGIIGLCVLCVFSLIIYLRFKKKVTF